MRRLVFLLLVSAICAGAAQAQNYREQVTLPAIGIGYTDKPHAAPRTVDRSSYYTDPTGKSAGSATVTFVSTPAPSVLARAQSAGGNVIVAGKLGYGFFYSSPALSYGPINFLGLFNLQHG